MSTSPTTFTADEQLLYLTTLSPRDASWNSRKAQSLAIADLYELANYNNMVARIRGCSGFLSFALEPDQDTGEVILKLRDALFCRVRHCSICQWRRQLMWLARTKTHLPRILADYPKHQFIFLTLTVRNCPLTDLRSTLSQMSKAWDRLTKRGQFPADGWLRNVEVTRAENDYAHPHYHALLMVKPSYFGGNYYLSQKKWTELWRSCMKLDYDPIVHVQRVKSDYAHTLESLSEASQAYAHETSNLLHGENHSPDNLGSHAGHPLYHDSANLSKAIFYCLKYSVKPDEFLVNAHSTESNSEWLTELTRQMHKTRAIALGGIFKEYMSEAEPEGLIHADVIDEAGVEVQNDKIVANWLDDAGQYVMSDVDLHDYNICIEVERKAEESSKHKADYFLAKK